MPADVMAALEAYCGEPIYSRAIMEERPSVALARGLLTEACDTAEAAVDLQKLTRAAAADGRVDAAERAQLEKVVLQLEDQVREFRAALDGGQP